MTTLTPDQLAELLRRQAAGSYATEAAVELLITHDRWLYRTDFLTTCVDYDHHLDDSPVAWIDWAQVPALLDRAPCSSSEARILALAASLAGIATSDPLDELLTGLDDTNAALVLDAITHTLTRGGGR